MAPWIRGMAALQLRKFEVAEEKFRKVLETDADSAGAWLGLAEALRGQKRFEDALLALDGAPSEPAVVSMRSELKEQIKAPD